MATLAALLDEQVEANIGMAMIYALVSAAQEWLQERVGCSTCCACMLANAALSA